MVSTPNDHRYRGKHDPYNNMEEASIRPENIAKQKLSEAEQSASKKQNVSSLDSVSSRTTTRRGASAISDATTAAKASERNQTSDNFRNSVQGRRQQGKQRGFFKRMAPIAIVASLVLGGGAFFYGAQSMLGPHLSAMYTNATDVQFSSYNFRNSRLMSYMLDGGGQIKISNFTKKYTTFTPYMQGRLRDNGIEVGHLNADGDFVKGQAIFGSSTVLKYGDEIIDANSFQDAFARNANFRESYYEAKRGRIVGFFDDVSMKYYSDRGATRDIFDEYKSTGDTDVDTDNFKTTVSDYVVGSDGSVNTISHGVDEETQEEYKHENGEDIDTKNIDGDTPEMKARSMVNSIASKVSSVGVPVCSALRIANLAAIAVSSYQIYQSIAYFLSLMEPISKTMAGEGDQAAINETLNFMTSQYTSEVNYVDSDGSQQTKNVTGSMLQSTGSKLVMGSTLSPRSETEPYSFSNITKAATTIAVSTGLTTTACSGVMAASAIVSLAAAGVPGGKLATFAVSMIMRTVGGVIITGIVASIVSAIIPYVAKIFASNIFETYTGIPAGELFSEGAASANFSLATEGSALMPSDKESVKQQNRNTTLALAQEAEVDRLNRSPFDATSTNTFMGSLLSKFTYMAYSNNAVSSITSFNNIAANAIRRLTPASSAADEELMYTSNYQECTNMPGAMCDMYDLPIVTSDFSTIDIKPDDPTYQEVISRNLDSNGDVADNSELAKFINFCKNRKSPWGVKDANILNALQTDYGIVVNNIPYINDFLDIVNAAEDIENEPWATGSNCMNSSSNPRWDSEFKYYQRYIEDMRILDSMEDEAGNNEKTVSTSEKIDKGQALSNHSTVTFYSSAASENGGNAGRNASSKYNNGNLADGQVAISQKDPELSLGDVIYIETSDSGEGSAANKHFYIVTDTGAGDGGVSGNYNIDVFHDPASENTSAPYGMSNNAKIYKIASDVSWDDYLKNYKNKSISLFNELEIKTYSNPILAYEAHYEALHPIDRSFEGTLARISGMTKNDIAFLREYVRYSTEIASYDPSTRYSFVEVEEPEQISFEESVIPTYAAIVEKTKNIFIDKRNYLV